MKGLDSDISPAHNRAVRVTVKPSVKLKKSMVAYGEKFGINHQCLEFVCNEKILSEEQLVTDVMGCLVFVRRKLENREVSED